MNIIYSPALFILLGVIFLTLIEISFPSLMWRKTKKYFIRTVFFIAGEWMMLSGWFKKTSWLVLGLYAYCLFCFSGLIIALIILLNR